MGDSPPSPNLHTDSDGTNDDGAMQQQTTVEQEQVATATAPEVSMMVMNAPNRREEPKLLMRVMNAPPRSEETERFMGVIDTNGIQEQQERNPPTKTGPIKNKFEDVEVYTIEVNENKVLVFFAEDMAKRKIHDLGGDKEIKLVRLVDCLNNKEKYEFCLSDEGWKKSLERRFRLDQGYTNKQCLLSLYVNCESQRQMHRLAQSYYSARDIWLHFLPLTVLTLFSGAFAFMATSDFFQSDTKEVFSLFVGVSSIVSVAVQSCAKNHNYGGKSKMHETVALGMKKLGDNVSFDQIDPESGLSIKNTTNKSANKANITEGADVNSNPGLPSATNADETTTDNNDKLDVASNMSEKVQGYRMVFRQVMESCDSIIPTVISEGFSLVDTRLAILLNNHQTQDKIENTLNLERVNARSIIVANTYSELYTVYSTTWFWPWRSPNPDDAVTEAIKKVETTYNKSRDLFNIPSNEETPLLRQCFP